MNSSFTNLRMRSSRTIEVIDREKSRASCWGYAGKRGASNPSRTPSTTILANVPNGTEEPFSSTGRTASGVKIPETSRERGGSVICLSFVPRRRRTQTDDHETPLPENK